MSDTLMKRELLWILVLIFQLKNVLENEASHKETCLQQMIVQYNAIQRGGNGGENFYVYCSYISSASKCTVRLS